MGEKVVALCGQSTSEASIDEVVTQLNGCETKCTLTVHGGSRNGSRMQVG